MNRLTVKLYGERNTGTNYLARLLHHNLPVELLPGSVSRRAARLQRLLPGREWLRDLYFRATFPRNLGWKHSAVRAPAALERLPVSHHPLGFVTLTKNPYAWLLSLHRRPQHQFHKAGLPFQAFLESPWQTVRRGNAPRTVPTPVALWNLKNRSYLQLDGWWPVAHVRYEDLLADPAAEVERIAQVLGVPWDRSGFKNIEQSTKDPGRTFASYQRYYLEERWREGLAPESIAIINRHLDHDLAAHFGYRRLPD